jgi:hypothetical protein
MALKRWDLHDITEEKFGTETASVHLIGQVFPNATVYICECLDDDFNETIQAVVTTCKLISNPQVGDGYEACNDRTKEHIGTFTIKNVVSIKAGKVAKSSNTRYLFEDFPVLTFK